MRAIARPVDIDVPSSSPSIDPHPPTIITCHVSSAQVCGGEDVHRKPAGVLFRVVTNLEEALWAYPATLSDGRRLPDGNKSLAVVGDAVLNLVVKHHCYVLKMKRGPASDLLQEVTCNAYLGAMSSSHEIAPFVAMNPGSRAMSSDMRATAVEAIIGAVYRDCGGDHDTLVNVITALGVL